ncbi:MULTISPECIES: RHS repeat-associated core domain-containing protein [Pseudomonas]|uniref:RHS repeat-associated core domain-containing protein n=1 Tax=Pseudomonas sp. NY5710 TaxID=2662033 RepID=UPI0020174BB4|nr:RHS repeat-associated core domain-containing protein [Pseudomonas sp. NY5710]
MKIFYNASSPCTLIEKNTSISIVRSPNVILAESESRESTITLKLLTCDEQNSLMASASPVATLHTLFTPFGYTISGDLLTTAFKGEPLLADKKGYLLGNGYRNYSPQLMRFHSTDTESPFGKGGLNNYAFALGDPVNISDPTGHFPFFRSYRRFSGKYISQGSPRFGHVIYDAKHPLQPGERILTIAGHGTRGAIQAAPNTLWDADDLYNQLRKLDRGKKEPIHLITCHGANSPEQGYDSLAMGLSKLTGAPVIAYSGSIHGQIKKTNSEARSITYRVTEKVNFLDNLLGIRSARNIRKIVNARDTAV